MRDTPTWLQIELRKRRERKAKEGAARLQFEAEATGKQLREIKRRRAK